MIRVPSQRVVIATLVAIAVLVLIAIGIWFVSVQRARESVVLKPSGVAVYATQGWEKWPDTDATNHTVLTTALFWEGSLKESDKGLRAIAWVIHNRVELKGKFPRDHTLPHTIRGVVTDGYKPGRRQGCQFSFVCNGAGESPEEFVRLQARMKVSLSIEDSKKRWERISKIAADFLQNPGEDPTKGTTHYWATTMKRPPYWVQTDIVPESVRKIGSHTFGRSKY